MSRLSLAIITAAFSVAFTQIASAADMPAKAPIAPLAAPSNWNGFYAGVSGGYAWRDRSVSINALDPVTVLFSSTPPATPLPDTNFNTNGGLGGVQLGYNWQFAPRWVAGIETDFSFSNINGSGSSSNIATIFSDPGTAAVSERINWFGTFRGRLGFLATNDLLVYGTGGFAYGRVKQEANYTLLPGVIGTTTSVTSSGFGVQCSSNNICFHGASSETRSGWTAGLGVEKALGSSVRFKLEYLYVNLGSNSFSMVAGNGAGATPASWAVHFNDADFHVVRVGVSVPLWAVSSRQ